jgi:dTDP-L-rhamnose 4-epimerase
MRILNNKPPILFEDGLGLRDYINVSDVATANLLVLEDDRANYNIYFVGGGKAYTAIKFAKTMLKVFNSNLTPQIPGIFRVGDTRSTVSSIKKLSKLGWKPKVDLETSLTEYKNWLITQQNLNDKSDIAMRKMIKSRIIRKIKTTHTS